MADPFTLGIAGGGALLNFLNGQNANSTAEEGLNFQKQQAQQAQKLGTATRVDANGNRQVYNAATNTWETQLTPLQQAIANAGQSEQLKSLTTDAQQNRNVRQRQFDLATKAIPQYTKASAGFQYDQPHNAKAIQDELTGLMTNADNAAASSNESLAGRTLLRQGRGGDLAGLVKTIQDTRGRALAQDQLKARTTAVPEAAQQQQEHNSRYLPMLQQLATTIGGGGGAPISYSNTPEALAATQAGQASGLAGAMGQSAANIGGAYNNLAKTIGGNGIDLKGTASLLTALNNYQKNANTSTDNAMAAAQKGGKAGQNQDFDSFYNSLGTGNQDNMEF